MKETTEYSDLDAGIPPNAIRVIDSNSAEEFPILKAFQKYIDAEQSKARKRMILLSVFFGLLLTIVIVVFLILLNNVSRQNQSLNDRVFDFMIKERDRQAAAVVVQPPSDTSQILSKIDALQQKIADQDAKVQAERKAQEAAAKIAAEREAKKGPTPQDIEIAQLKALLANERQKAEEERERRHQQELEIYRRKHYPEFYAKPAKRIPEPELSDDVADQEILQILEDLDDDAAIDYYNEDDPEQRTPSRRKAVKESRPTYTIPVEVNGSSRSWRIPESGRNTQFLR